MDSRERVFRALNHEEPDRVPIDFWASQGAWDVIHRATGLSENDFLEARDIDFWYIAGPAYTGSALAPDTDIWWVKRRVVQVPTRYGTETYSEVDVSPLQHVTTAEEVDAYPGWPSPDDYDYAAVKSQARAVRDAGRVAVFMGDRLNRIAQLKPAMYLRGIEQILIDLTAEPEIARAIFRRFRAFYVEYLDRILEAADGMIDIVLTGDDFGQQSGPLISPALWEEFLAGGFAEYTKVIRAHGVRSMHHTCGDVRLLVGRMQELGLDILQSLQPEAMADWFPEMRNRYGRRLSFQGGISIQQTMPHGTPDDVRAEVADRMRVLAPGGGYIFCTAHNLQADCPYENIAALLDAYVTVGRYTGSR